MWRDVASLVVSPETPPTFYAIAGLGIYRSTDRAATWVPDPRDGLPGDATLYSLAIDYRAPGTLYVTTSAGIYLLQAGRWTLVNTLAARSLAVDLEASHVLWAGVPYSTEYGALVLRSEDAGRTWAPAGAGLPGDRQNWVAQILMDPVRPDTLYANVRSSGRRGWPEGWLYRGGRNGTWELLPMGAPIDPTACMANGLALDPNGRRLWVGCDAYYYNVNRLSLFWTEDLDTPSARDVAWQHVADLGTSPAAGTVSAVRALAVDAGTSPSAVYVARPATREPSGEGLPLAMLVTRNQGATWDAVPAPQLP